MVCSIGVSAWMGFGQMLARNAGFYSVSPKETLTSGCPKEWGFNISTTTTSVGG